MSFLNKSRRVLDDLEKPIRVESAARAARLEVEEATFATRQQGGERSRGEEVMGLEEESGYVNGRVRRSEEE